MHSFNYGSIGDFERTAYVENHQCSCGGTFEISDEEANILISNIRLHFIDLHLLVCLTCNNAVIPFHSSRFVHSAYDQAVKKGQTQGEFRRTSHREKFNYCVEQDFMYDHFDYYNIPGLMHDEEHRVEGFLTPVYFDRKVLQQFLLDEDYCVKLGAETYGDFRMRDEWIIPFGINLYGNVVFWLGDLNDMDNVTLSRMKPYNIESDHKLISSEFYAGQMCCEWAQPNREYRIYQLRNELYELFRGRYGVNLDHLPEETKNQIEEYNKPIIVNSKTFPETVAVLHQVLIESVNLDELRRLYSMLLVPKDKKYTELKAIKLYEGLVEHIIKSSDQVIDIVAPLYLLNDLRICYDHLLPAAERIKKQQNVVSSLKLSSFDDMTKIYDELLKRLTAFYEYLIIGYSVPQQIT